MSTESTTLPKHYSSKEAESVWYRRWEESGCFRGPLPRRSARSFAMVIPPPNVTGVLHMGHALNNTLQDVLARFHRMNGCDTVWIPGTDHAGIATQAVVDRHLRAKGVEREKIGREAFVGHVWEWKEKHGNTIIEQLRRLGCSCDWERTRFTLDEGLSAAVREVFVRLYDKGLIYKSRYIVNWSVGCQTALSDEEVIHKEITGALYHIRYSIAGSSESVVIATTRPETLLGDTAIGFNPNDSRYAFLRGKKAVLPLLNRPLAIIEDEGIDPQFGTGVLKITPGHDPVDFEFGIKHKLPLINILNPDGTLNANAGPYQGLERFEARKRIIEDLKAAGQLVKIEEHRHSVGHCYRTDTIVEPYCSEQWFVRMKPLAEPALEAVRRNEIRFHPKRWTKVYEDWMVNIRDWCISRQIWWGHRIPVYYTADGRHTAAHDAAEARRKLGVGPDEALTQDPDVLDTWFSSWLWPFSTMGWPKSDRTFDSYYPTQALVTGYEIIFFWVARMIMSGFEFTGKAPFTDIYIHGIVRDQTGAKMSKSKGNVVDPIEIIDEYGADALRYSILSITGEGQDVFVAKDRFEIGRNFANKIWNASRFVLTATAQTPISGTAPDRAALRPADRWILHRLKQTVDAVADAIQGYHFNRMTELLYDFIWGDFCDWYLELAKPYAAEPATAWTLRHALETSLKLIHPLMPFVTEEIWQKLSERKPDEFLMTSRWPAAPAEWSDAGAAEDLTTVIRLIEAARKYRGIFRIQPGDLTDLSVRVTDRRFIELLRQFAPEIQRLGRIRQIKADESLERPAQSAMILVGPMTAYLHLGGVLDLTAETRRLEADREQTAKALAALKGRLANPDFTGKAPQEIIEKEKTRLLELETKLAGLQDHIRSLA